MQAGHSSYGGGEGMRPRREPPVAVRGRGPVEPRRAAEDTNAGQQLDVGGITREVFLVALPRRPRAGLVAQIGADPLDVGRPFRRSGQRPGERDRAEQPIGHVGVAVDAELRGGYSGRRG